MLWNLVSASWHSITCSVHSPFFSCLDSLPLFLCKLPMEPERFTAVLIVPFGTHSSSFFALLTDGLWLKSDPAVGIGAFAPFLDAIFFKHLFPWPGLFIPTLVFFPVLSESWITPYLAHLGTYLNRSQGRFVRQMQKGRVNLVFKNSVTTVSEMQLWTKIMTQFFFLKGLYRSFLSFWTIPCGS